MNLIIRLTFLSLIGISCIAKGQGTERQTIIREWRVDGINRQATVYIPKEARSRPTPVIFLFHGHGGNMKEILKNHNFSELWPEAILVVPQGLNTPGQLLDPEGNYTGWQKGPGEQNDRDLRFFDEMLHSLKSEFHINEQQIYATGHSNGGSFTYILWAMRGNILAAVAPSAAAAFAFNNKLTPKPVMHIMGKNDKLVKAQWQKMQFTQLKKLNRCQSGGVPYVKFATLYPSLLNMTTVLYEHPGAHVYPKEANVAVIKFFKSIILH